MGTAATENATAFATAAQGALADTALQDATAFATAAQGALADTALQASNNLSDITNVVAARTALGIDVSGTDNSTNVSLATVTDNYLSLSNQEITAGTIPVSLGGTGSTTAPMVGVITAANAAAARTALGVDGSGTDNSTNVSLAGSLDYLTLSNQEITLGQVDYDTDISNTPTLLQLGTTSSTALAGNTTTITTTQSNAITTNSAKVSDSGTPALKSDGSDPSLNTGITAAEIRSLIGVDAVSYTHLTLPPTPYV